MKTRVILGVMALGVITTVCVLLAQDRGPKPTCRNCPATYVSSDEIQPYLKRPQDHNLVDQQTRAVDIGKANIGIGVVYRGKLDRPAADSLAEHDPVSEVYHILDGSASL